MLGGSGGVFPRFLFAKNGAIWFNLGFLKYVPTNLKINISKVNISTTKLNYHIFLPDQSRCAW